MDTDKAELKVLDKDAQKTFINIGEFNFDKIDYVNPVIFDKILKNISYKKCDYDTNLNFAKKYTKAEAGLIAQEGTTEEGIKFIDIVNKWDEQELLRMNFAENGTIDNAVYIVNEEKHVGIRNENEGESQLYLANSGLNGELEIKNNLIELKNYINAID